MALSSHKTFLGQVDMFNLKISANMYHGNTMLFFKVHRVPYKYHKASKHDTWMWRCCFPAYLCWDGLRWHAAGLCRASKRSPSSTAKEGVKRERERVLFYEHVPLQLCVVWPSTHKYYFTFSIFLIRPLICPIYEFTLRLNSAFF